MPRENNITIYLRAEVREALDELAARWGVSKQATLVRALLAAAEDER